MSITHNAISSRCEISFFLTKIVERQNQSNMSFHVIITQKLWGIKICNFLKYHWQNKLMRHVTKHHQISSRSQPNSLRQNCWIRETRRGRVQSLTTTVYQPLWFKVSEKNTLTSSENFQQTHSADMLEHVME